MVVFLPAPIRLVRPEWSGEVPAPAYDALSASERRRFREEHRHSYLNVTLAPEDEPPTSVRSAEELLAAGRDALEELLTNDVFVAVDEPVMYLYRIADAHHAQVGIVGEVPISEYDNGTVRIHEEVRPPRVEMLARHMETVGAVSSPVALAIRNSVDLVAWMDQVMATEPALDFGEERDGGLHQTVWRIDNPDMIAQASMLVADETTYIIDGHHRAAASSLSAAHSDQIGSMLVALFPDAALTLLGFHRWITEVPNDVLEILAERFGLLEAAPGPPELSLGRIAVYVDGSWFAVELATAAGEFDAVNVRRDILPLVGIADAGDVRLVNVPGDQPIEELTERVDAEGGMAIVMAPIEMEAFLAAADAGVILPPKSTYFTPKVRSGVFLRPFERLAPTSVE